MNRKPLSDIEILKNTYRCLLRRCYNLANDNYKYYGGKGVIVCAEWLKDFNNFYEWAIANGWQKGLQLDKDSKGNGLLYSPETCCWVSKKYNIKVAKAKKIIYKGEEVYLMDLNRQLGFHRNLVEERINRNGWTLEESVSRKKKHEIFTNFGAFIGEKLIHKFKNIQEALDALGGERKRYTRALQGKTKISGGFTFKYITNEN